MFSNYSDFWMMIFFYVISSLSLLSMLFFVNHPISMGLILIVYATLVGLYIISFSVSWFFYLLVLVFLGGVMVLIIYMSTLSSNEKFLSLRPKFSMFSFILTMGFMLSVPIYNMSSKMETYFSSSTILYEQDQLSSLSFLMIYLLLVLVCVVKLVKFEFGPLIKRL